MEVTLRRPVPLGTPLSVRSEPSLALHHRGEVVAEARRTDFSRAPPLVLTYGKAAVPHSASLDLSVMAFLSASCAEQRDSSETVSVCSPVEFNRRTAPLLHLGHPMHR